MIKHTLVIAICGLLCFMGTGMALPYYDWPSPSGVVAVHYNTWLYPTPAYHTYHYYTGFAPVVYNSFDPWWAANVYGPLRTTYYWNYWDGWGWW